MCNTGTPKPASVPLPVGGCGRWRVQWDAVAWLAQNDRDLCADEERCPWSSERSKVENSA